MRIIYRCDGYPDCGSDGQEDEDGCGPKVHAGAKTRDGHVPLF